jgi:hypothetical protein
LTPAAGVRSQVVPRRESVEEVDVTDAMPSVS